MNKPIEPPGPRDHKTPAIDSLGGLFLITFAKVVGYAALLILAVVIMRRAHWSLSVTDVLFWLCAVAIPIAQQRTSVRFETAGAHGPTPLMPRLLVHLGVAALLWAGAHSLHFV